MELKEYQQLTVKINNAKTALNKAEGANEVLLSRLNTQYKLKSLEDAKTELQAMIKTKTKIESRIEKLSNELSSLFDWDSI